MSTAHLQLSSPPSAPPSRRSRERVDALIRAHGWATDPEAGHAAALAAALDPMDEAGQPMTEDNLAVYVVIGTLLSEPVLVSLRRIAHEDLARRGPVSP